jgi:putative hemolysin
MKIWTVVLVGAFTLSACASPLRAEEESPVQQTYGATIGIVNHTEKYIYSTTVDGGEAGHAQALSAGVGSMCCVNLPRKWHPGLKVEVGWDMPEGTKHVLKSKIVDVEKYDRPGTLYLHFFPDDTVRVVVTNTVGASPNHPIAPPAGTMLKLY